ncbi:MAG TPA: prepilin peptidase [Patescibacteria group bacterium]|nr:prepilin peptidase [Patescibacteria group bacterium]
MTAVLIFILGLICGSFLNAVIFRLKAGEQFIKGRSKCPACARPLGFWDLIPIFSFVFLKAKCRYCRQAISWQYPAVELFTGLVFLAGYFKYLAGGGLSQWPQLAVFLVLACFLTVILVYDLRYYLILDKVSLPALAAALLFNFLLGKSVLNMLFAAAVVAGFFLLQFIVSKGKWIGGGDIRLGLVVGAMLGWPEVLPALLLAYVLGSVVGLCLVALKKKRWKSEMPFGTFLSFTAIISLLWSEGIIRWYLGF